MIILGCALHDSTAGQDFNLVFLKEGEAVLSDLGKLATDRSRFGAFLQALHCLHRGHNFGGGGALSVKEALDASPQTVHNRLPMIFNLKTPLPLRHMYAPSCTLHTYLRALWWSHLELGRGV